MNHCQLNQILIFNDELPEHINVLCSVSFIKTKALKKKFLVSAIISLPCLKLALATRPGPIAGVFFSEGLNAFLMVEDDRLRLIDSQTHKPVPNLNEALSQLEIVTERVEQEAQRAEQERRRAEQAEAELARLRERRN